MELLKCMDKLFVPQPATRSQQCKCKSWEALLKKGGIGGVSGKDAVCGSQSRQDLTKIKECIREDIIRCMNRERVVSDEESRTSSSSGCLIWGMKCIFPLLRNRK